MTIFLKLCWTYKKWIAIAVFIFLYIWQIAYTNHLSSKLKKADMVCAEKVKNEVAKALKPYEEAKIRQQTKANTASSDYEKLKSEQQIKTESVKREVQKFVERPVYFNTCFDIDGVQQINDLINSGKASSAEQLSTSMP
ncbi:hypothetical protein [Acinetobacter gerneri]|uniref:hypothetical protein n=1 Tax=Acinetobacter gerneri TaxID=202952 RepID=UPI003212AB76